MPEFDDLLPAPIRRELRREPRLEKNGALPVARVMAAVRREAARPARGGWLSPLVGGALAASVLLAMIGGAAFHAPRMELSAGVTTEADAALGTALRDTLRLVRFALTAPGATRVAVVGDFNGWRAGATLLVRGDTDGRWTAAVALARGAHRFAYVVDDTQWVADRGAPAAVAPNGRPASRLVVPSPE